MIYAGRLLESKIGKSYFVVLATGEPDEAYRFPGTVVRVYSDAGTNLTVGHHSINWNITRFSLAYEPVQIDSWKLNGIGPLPEGEDRTGKRIHLKKKEEKMDWRLRLGIYVLAFSLVLHFVQVIVSIMRACQ